MKQEKKIYDINYRLTTTSILSIVATSKNEAREKALKELEEMPQAELIERFVAALNFEPEFTITNCEFIENWE